MIVTLINIGFLRITFADVLDIQIGTVKSRLSRARNQLKKILERGNLSRRASSESMEGEVAAK